jgi:hypothetical protein
MKTTLFAVALLCLTACGEKPQGIGGVKNDTAPYTGTGKVYAAQGWKQGDQKSWESQIRARTQNGQNDYVKAP